MIIKEIELFGFKSFVDRVKFNFKPGITALVGPNGCGKSNVIDALRWIMGEHNARHLRGTKMEDLIFNGTDTRKPTGMAEVSMVLSNDGGNGDESPLGNATELMITRRLFRSGESEYFINKVPCRMKDIVELFLDSGVGTKSYSIMEQGKVDEILSLKPDERRILIEEAAGISKYRSRKKEALSKIESTKSNLLRLKDILNEIQVRMRWLELQVKRLKRYRNIKEEIKHIDLLLISNRLHFLKASQNQYKNELSKYRDEEIQISANKNSTEATLEKTRLCLTELQKKVDLLQQDFYETKNLIQKEENSLQINEGELKNTSELIEKSKHNLEELENELQHIDNELVSRESDLSSINSGIESLENSFKTSSETLSLSKMKLKEIQDRIENEKGELIKTVYEKTENKNAIILNRRLQEEITTKLQKLKEEKETCHISVKELEEKKAVLEKRLNELIIAREQKEKEIEVLRARINCLEKIFHEKDTSLNDLKDRLGTVRARLNSLQDLQKNLEGFDEGVRTIMNIAKDGTNDVNGIVGLFADIIETSPQYEPAVEAALDRKLQSIIVETQQDGLNAIEHLKQENSGRVSFIPLTLRDGNVNDIMEQNTVPLESIIETKQEYRSVIGNLLGDVLLVENISQALEIWGRNQTKQTIVTKEGEVIEPKGIVTGGSTNGSGSGILKRNREIREFSEELRYLETQFQATKSEKEKIEQDLSHAKRSFESLAAERQEFDIKLVQEKTKEEQAERELLQEKEKDRLICFEESESVAALEKHQTELEQLLVKESLQQQTEAEKQQGLKELQQSEEDLKKELEQSELHHTDLMVSLASVKQKQENVLSNLKRLSDQKKTSESKTDALNTERENLVRKTDTLSQDIKNIKEQLQTLVEQSRKIDTQIDSDQKNVQDLEDSVKSGEDSLKDLRNRRDEIEPKIHETELNLSNLSIHLEHLLKEISEKYNISFEQLPPPPETDSFNEDESNERIEKLKKRLENIGEVNLGASREFEELEKRYLFLCSQEEDLLQSLATLQKVIVRINKITKQKFSDAFTAINGHFQQLFPMLFNGGKAYMSLTDESDLLETGIEIFAQPPGKKLQGLDLLSGGERALTVIAIMFAIFLTKPSPFCLMDEIDAPLDDNNIEKFITHLKKMADRSQFIIVTHNKLSMQAAGSLYGITMEEQGISKTVSVELN